MLIVTGMPGAGKDEFIKVARSMGFVDVHMGDTVRKHSREHAIEQKDYSIGKFAGSERLTHGMDIWARRTAENIKEPDKTIVDGLRNVEELDYFRNKFDNVRVVAIYANHEDRLDRILKRDREDDVKNPVELNGRDERELSWGIGRVISLADYMIVNDGTLDEFRSRAREFIIRIEKDQGEKS